MKRPATGPVTGSQLMGLNKWELVQLALQLGKDLDPAQLREHMRVIREHYTSMGATAKSGERKLGIWRTPEK